MDNSATNKWLHLVFPFSHLQALNGQQNDSKEKESEELKAKENKEPDKDEEEDDDEEDYSSDPDIEEEIQASQAQVGPGK